MHFSDMPEIQRRLISLRVKNKKAPRQTLESQLFQDNVTDHLSVSEFQNHTSNCFNALLCEVPT